LLDLLLFGLVVLTRVSLRFSVTYPTTVTEKVSTASPGWVSWDGEFNDLACLSAGPVHGDKARHEGR
jgi:hypothetical protein